MARRDTQPKIVRGLLHPAVGPTVRIKIGNGQGLSSKGLAVLDTGATRSAIDKEVAFTLGLPTYAAATWFAISNDAPRDYAPLRRGQLRIGNIPHAWELDFIEVASLAHAVDDYPIIALIGWDFLDKCKLSFDGPAGTFSLELPTIRGNKRKR